MTANTSDKVYFAPKAQIYIAGVDDIADKLPTDLTATLDPGWKSLGYVGEDGISCTPKREFDPVSAAQSASPIKYVLKSASLALKFVLLQMDTDTVELYFGDKWSTTGGVNKISLKSSPTLAEHALLVEYGDYTETAGTPPTLTGTKNRLVIPRGMVSDLDEIKIARSSTLSLGLTFEAMDESGELGYLLSNAV